jgi:hypothetical protein
MSAAVEKDTPLPPPSWLKNCWQTLLVVGGVFGLMAFPRLIRLGEFAANDEFYIWELANRFFLAFVEGRFADTVVHGYPAVTLMWVEALGVWIRYAVLWLMGQPVSIETLLGLDTPFALLPEKQIALALANSLLMTVIFWLAWKVYSLPAALAGAVLVAFDPFLLAESRIIRTEGLVSGSMLLSVLAALLYLKEQRPYALILSAVFAALAALTKSSAIFLFPTVALLGTATVFCTSAPLSWRETKQWLWRYLGWAGLTVFCIWLFWPAMWVAPLKTLQVIRTFVEDAGGEGFGGRGVFFWGQVYPDDPGPWFYPVTILFRLTPLALVGIIIAIVVLLLTFRQHWLIRKEVGWQWWGATVLLAYSLLFFIMMTLGAKKYDRYLMPIYPALDLMAGIGWFWLGGWLVRRWLKLRRVGLTLGIGWVGLLLFQSLTALPHLPYYYTYYNPLLGGPRQAVNYIRVGFGEGLDQPAAYLESKPNVTQLKLASGNSSRLKGVFSGQTIALDNLDGKWVQADYVLTYIAQVQRKRHSEDILAYLARHEPEYTLVLHGLEYAWLYPGPAAQYYGGGHKLEGRGTFYGYDLDKVELAAGETLSVTLYWRNEGQREGDCFFVRLMDIDGYVWAEAIAQPRPGFEEANRQRKSIVESEAVLTLPVGMPPGDYFFKPGFRTTSGEIIGYFELPGDTKPIKITTAQAYPPVGAFQPPHPGRLMVNEDLTLLGYDLDPDTSTPGSALWVTLYWQALTDVTHDYVILLRLLDVRQEEVAYWLGRPVRSGYPTTEWQAWQIVQDPWLLIIPPEATPGSYQLEIAIFDAATQAELDRQTVGRIIINSK